MKFGKRMRGLASPSWAGDYVDYKLLKRQIKQPQPPSSADFRALLAAEMAKVNAAYERIYEQLAGDELASLRRALGNRWVLSPAKARALLLDALELSHRVDVFRRFVVLNALAFVKIAKKFDKTAGTDLKTAVMDNLNLQPFYQGRELDALCEQTAALTDRIMLCVLPDGNYRLQDSLPTCPICLGANTKSPITLSCGHTFCWSCLSKAVEHRFTSCPLCRMEQSIDPRDYEIDGLIKRFKRAYEFVENGLDRAPFASSPMRQILSEAFDQVDGYLMEVEAQYATLSPRGSTSDSTDLENLADSHIVDEEKTYKVVEEDVNTRKDAEAEPMPEPLTPLNKGDPVQVLYGNHWYPGMVMECNRDGETYSVLWWVKENSQRFGQRVRRDQLREPILVGEGGDSSALYDYAAGVLQSATEWALEPFRRLRSISSERSSM